MFDLYVNFFEQTEHLNCGSIPHSNFKWRQVEPLFLYDFPQLLGQKNLVFDKSEK